MHYLAGIVDGEGSFYISAEKDSTFTYNFRLRPRFRLEMKETEENEEVHRLIMELCEELKISSLKQRRVETTTNTTYRSEISGMSDIGKFAQELIPYLRIKRGIAEELMVFQETTKGKHTTRERFASILEARKNIRKKTADREVKYDYDRIKRELD